MFKELAQGYSGFGMTPACTDAETYGTCVGGGGRQYNLDPLLDVNRYADIEMNPYVVGSYAYNIAHGLPQTEGNYLDRIAARQAAAQAAANVNTGSGQDSGLAIAPPTAPVALSLTTAAIIAAVVLWVAVK